jgi:cysteine synthase A
MSNIADSLTGLVGNTPLLALNKYAAKKNAQASIIAKIEYFNPLFSVKDRVGIAMIEDAEKKGLLKKGSTIIEPTSGNTGIALAFAAAARGYQAVIVMPDTMSAERRKMIKHLGARVELSDGKEGMAGSIRVARELAQKIPDSFIPSQFDNPANPKAHRETTGREIWRDTDGKVDIFIAGVGSGGTVSGVGRALKEKNPEVRIIAVEPEGSNVLSGGQAGPNGIQGLGAGFVPEVYDPGAVDEVICISDEEAFDEARAVARLEGLPVGISSGAALAAAAQVAARPENRGKMIVALLPDSAERYMSTPLFED